VGRRGDCGERNKVPLGRLVKTVGGRDAKGPVARNRVPHGKLGEAVWARDAKGPD
jgi:hypothetical protein